MMLRTWQDDSADFLLAWGIVPTDLGQSRADQTRDVFAAIDRLLGMHGMTFAHVVRTWFYCDRINDWYAEFNATRTEFFTAHRVFETFLPASTGIGHANPFGAALMAGFFAMRPHDAASVRAVAEMVHSPRQTDAMTYRSSFSRAAEVRSASGRRLFVSGTASILPNSTEVAYPGDVDRQIETAMSAACAILESRGMGLGDVSRAIVYLKCPEYRANWFNYLAAHALPHTFAAILDADVCRPEWLFEVEMDACQ